MKKTLNYKYNIGDIIINVKFGKLKILKQIKISHEKYKEKRYEYQCLICGNIDTIAESHLIEKHGCNVCCPNPQKVLKGYNDMWTTNPKLAKLLANPENGYKYTEYSHEKIDWKCPNCGYIIQDKTIANTNKAGLSCPKCSDGISYPNKLIFNILEQLSNINFENEKFFIWSNNKKYDFYIPKLSIIIEANGNQHYQEEFSKIKSNKRIRTLQEEQENDKLKKELALANGIKEENYIIIDCRKSDLEFIKNNILNSRLNEIFDLSKIDWLQSGEFACDSLVKIVCDLWSNKKYTINKISETIKLSRKTVREYLNKGKQVQLCNYNVEEQIINNKFKKREVVCLNDNKIFKSISEASKYYNLNIKNHISDCCLNKYKYCGIHPITGEKLKWKYYNN